MLVTVVQLLMVLVSTSFAQLTFIAIREAVRGINTIRMNCTDAITGPDKFANYFRRNPQDGSEQSVFTPTFDSVLISISVSTEGFYLCNNSMGQSNMQPINGKIIYDCNFIAYILSLLCSISFT